MHQYTRHFTLAEARAAIPLLRAAFTAVHSHRNRVHLTDDKLGQLLHKTNADIGSAAVNTMLRDLVQLNAQLRELSNLGIVIKDIERGLVDFPHLRNGAEVFLCWELDEDDIEFWHDLNAGYAGRERL
jgi:hypothetical protein